MKKIKSCSKGHLMTADNIVGQMRFRCKTCMREKSKESYRKGKKLNKVDNFNQNMTQIREMFDAHVIKRDDGHWDWTKNRAIHHSHREKRSATKETAINNITYNVLDLSYSLYHGRMIKGFYYNICDHEHCVNPDHIVHSMRWFIRTVRTNCSKGHDLTDPNNYVEYKVKDSENLYKKCKVCRRINDERRERSTTTHSN